MEEPHTVKHGAEIRTLLKLEMNIGQFVTIHVVYSTVCAIMFRLSRYGPSSRERLLCSATNNATYYRA